VTIADVTDRRDPMKTTLIIAVAAIFLSTAMPVEARKARILRDTPDTIGWSMNRKTKKWKRIRVVGPKDAVKRHRDLYIKEYRRKLKEGKR